MWPSRANPRRSSNKRPRKPVRILIAPDKFKGTLTAQEAAEAIARGWRKSRPDDVLTLLPISDGGDGFGRVLGDALPAKPRRITTVDAAHCKCDSTWWCHSETRTAVIESANVIGLAMLPPGKFHPFQLDTFGLGKVIQAATKRGAKKIILGIGGSATNDGGFGLARALGWEFFNARGEHIELWTQLYTLAEIRRTNVLRLPKIIVAVDVRNPLFGKRGCTRVFGPQKGLRAEEFLIAERNLRRLAAVVKASFGFDFANTPGAGAAGGLGFGLATFARGELRPGFELLASHTGLLKQLGSCDLVITGEGALDASTLMGKGAGQLAAMCRARKVPVIGLAGVVEDSWMLRRLFTETHALTQFTTPDVARRQAARLLGRLACRVALSLKTAIESATKRHKRHKAGRRKAM